MTGVISTQYAECRVSALTRTFAAHELLSVGEDFLLGDFQSLKDLLTSRGAAVRIGSLRA
jgi:hypothetical protein